jgi:hypothetical protein
MWVEHMWLYKNGLFDARQSQQTGKIHWIIAAEIRPARLSPRPQKQVRENYPIYALGKGTTCLRPLIFAIDYATYIREGECGWSAMNHQVDLSGEGGSIR